MRAILTLLASVTWAKEPPTDVVLFFSSYLEGAGYNKFLEIVNKGTAAAKLDDFAFPSTANGHDEGHEFWNVFTAGATLPPGGYYIIAHPDASDEIVSLANQTHKYLSNGNDAYALVYGKEDDYSIIDSIGIFGPDPGSAGWDVCGVSGATKDHSLLRKPSVTVGNKGNWETSRGSTTDDCEWYVKAPEKYVLHGSVSKEDIKPQAMVKTIQDVQSSESLRGQLVNVTGVITGVVTNSWVFMQATGVATDYSGLMLYKPAPRPKRGDLIVATGRPAEYYGVTQMADPKIAILGSAAIPAPVVLKTGGLDYAMYEGMLVKVQGVTVTNANADADADGTDYGEFLVDDGSGEMRVDDASRSITHDPEGGEEYDSIIGVLHYSYSNFKLLPRDDCDLLLKGAAVHQNCSKGGGPTAKASADSSSEDDGFPVVIVVIACSVAVIAIIVAVCTCVMFKKLKKRQADSPSLPSDVVLGRPVEEGEAASPAEVASGSAATSNPTANKV